MITTYDYVLRSLDSAASEELDVSCFLYKLSTRWSNLLRFNLFNMSQVQLNTIKADGVNVFYRSTGPPTAPVLLLLHGFPASSFQFRELIPLLASKFRVLAPDLPAFGFTEVPAERNYKYTFDSLSITIEAFLDALNVGKFAVYIFDYGVRTLSRSLLSLHHIETHHRMLTQTKT